MVKYTEYLDALYASGLCGHMANATSFLCVMHKIPLDQAQKILDEWMANHPEIPTTPTGDAAGVINRIVR